MKEIVIREENMKEKYSFAKDEVLTRCSGCGRLYIQHGLVNMYPELNEDSQDIKEEFKDVDGMFCVHCFGEFSNGNFYNSLLEYQQVSFEELFYLDRENDAYEFADFLIKQEVLKEISCDIKKRSEGFILDDYEVEAAIRVVDCNDREHYLVKTTLFTTFFTPNHNRCYAHGSNAAYQVTPVIDFNVIREIAKKFEVVARDIYNVENVDFINFEKIPGLDGNDYYRLFWKSEKHPEGVHSMMASSDLEKVA